MIRILKFPFQLPRIALLDRRQFNLLRWTRSRAFADLHAPVVGWLDSHLAMIERGAPWLDRVGIDVWDRCSGAIYSRFDFSLSRRFRATAGCARNVIVVYGFDGRLTQRLDQIGEALSAAGWERTGPLAHKAWVDAGGYAVLEWQPSAALSRPPGMDDVPPWGLASLSPHMRLSWSSHGQATSLRPDPNRTRSNTRNHLAVEGSNTAYWELPGVALERHDHALAVHIDLAYYQNTAPLGRPYRLPRHMLPTRAGR
ncbi:MAG TPA: hypothetical protein VFU74_11410 [Actinocrinis sp.]|nr:hypothetical protein [Actinocrinis sp.]